MAFIGILSVVVIIVGIVWSVIALIMKKNKMKPLITLGVGIAACIVAVIATPSSEEFAEAQASSERVEESKSKEQEAEASKEAEESKEQAIQESKEAKASEESQEKEVKESKQKEKEETEASKKKEEAENIDENFEFNDFNFEIYGAKINNESITLYMEYENMGYTDETPPISAVAVDVEQNGENLSSDNDKMKARGEDKTGAYADVKLGTKMPFTETFELENKKDDLEISIVPMMSDEESKKTKIELN